mmetsp:Transcript_5088/g.12154  ORF Transcript_5088/g.12154 Transcript_5088/m.12154 type:complete len:212 (-) Transcript_5088:632-1267(-)
MSLSSFDFSNMEGMKPSITFESSLSSCIGRNTGNRSNKASFPVPPCECSSISSISTVTLYRIDKPMATIAFEVSMEACEMPLSSITETSMRNTGDAKFVDGELASRSASKMEENAVRSTLPSESANLRTAFVTSSAVLSSNPGSVFNAFSNFGTASKIASSRSGVVATISSVSSSMLIVASFASGFGSAVTFFKETLAVEEISSLSSSSDM